MTPTQADRNAAAAYFDTVGDHLRAEITRRGEYDLSAAVKAFAQHRSTTEQAARTTTPSLADPLDLAGHVAHEAAALAPSDRERMEDGFASMSSRVDTLASVAARTTTTEGVREAAEALLRCHDARGAVEHRKDLWEALAASLATPPATPAAKECPQSPDGRHQVDTSMESGPNNCFHCEAPMGGRHVL